MNLRKAIAVLRALGDAETEGLQAGDLSKATGLNRVAVHRFLRTLGDEGLVERDDVRCYHLGPQAWLLGMAANRRFDLATMAAASLDRIEAETHDTIYLLRRVGDDVLCVGRRDGSYPIKSLVMEVGKAYPLGVGGGGLAVLAALDDGEVKQVLGRVRTRLAGYPKVTAARIGQLLADTREQGYAFWPALISEAFVVAVPILDAARRPVGALSCAAIKERLDPKRRKRVGELLAAEALAIRKRMGPPRAKRQAT